jgi:hypothetical protein
MKPTPLLLIAGGAVALFGCADAQPPQAAQNSASVVAAEATVDQGKVSATKAELRDLWIGHAFWVRNVAAAELRGDRTALDTAERQVVANAHAIAASIEPFYGAEARSGFFDLLAGHYAAIKGYIDAILADDVDKQSAASANLLNNATQLAVFLSGANPHLPKDTVEGLLQAHGGHHLAQIQQIGAGDYEAEAKTWAEMTQHLYVIADATVDALAKQFPAKF